jgi:hypothetical protein
MPRAALPVEASRWQARAHLAAGRALGLLGGCPRPAAGLLLQARPAAGPLQMWRLVVAAGPSLQQGVQGMVPVAAL